jgi:hypothetical protein
MASPEPTPFDGVVADFPATETESAQSPIGDLSMVAAIRRFIAVQARLDALEAEQKVLKREEQELSSHVIEMMIEEGMDSPPGVDGMTSYLKPVHYVEKNIDPETAEEFTSEEIRDALIEAGLANMIKESYNGNQLRALLKEYSDHDSKVPAPLARVVTLKKRRQLAVTPMAARKQSAAPRSRSTA